jgi:hypothetical protein
MERPGEVTTSERLLSRLRLDSLPRSPRVRVGAVVVVAVIGGLLAWLLTSGTSSSPSTKAVAAHAASVQELARLTGSVKHPVYWAGPRPGFTYELTQLKDGRIYIRYLPTGVAVASSRPSYLTVGTYPVKNAVTAVRAIAKREKTTTFTLSRGGVAVQDVVHPTSVYFAYPGSDYQVEVFDPSSARARQLVISGQISALGSTHAAAVRPQLVTPRNLRALETSLGHPLYWVGPQAGIRYELTRTTDGRIYIRYLPPGAKPGDVHLHTTVGTYPLQDAPTAIKAIAKRTGTRTFTIAGGAIAVVDPKHATSVYLAFPKSDLEIEVFDPSAPRARQLVTSGRVVPVR